MLCLIAALFWTISVSCVDKPNGVEPDDSKTNILSSDHRDSKFTLNVLCVGNSYTWDAFLYVPYLMTQIFPKAEFNFTILCTGGLTVDKLYQSNMLRDAPFAHCHVSDGYGSWVAKGQQRLRDILGERDWDIITMQQSSVKSGDYRSYVNVSAAVAWIKSGVGGDPRIVWIQTPSYPDTSHRLPGPDDAGIVTGFENSDAMYEAIADNSRRLMEDVLSIDYLIPVGTAIANARHTSLAGIGRAGQLSVDNVHLQEGLPRLLAAFTSTQTIINNSLHCGEMLHFATDVLINREFCDRILAQGLTTGAIVGISDDNVELAVKCALAAIESPFAMTPLN